METKKSSLPQIEKFEKIARATECDESEAAFEAKLKRIAKSTVQPANKKTKRKTDNKTR